MGWHEEVQTQHARPRGQMTAHVTDQEARGVAGQWNVRRHQGFELAEQLLFERQIFGGRLDHNLDVLPGKVFQLRISLNLRCTG